MRSVGINRGETAARSRRLRAVGVATGADVQARCGEPEKDLDQIGRFSRAVIRARPHERTASEDRMRYRGGVAPVGSPAD